MRVLSVTHGPTRPGRRLRRGGRGGRTRPRALARARRRSPDPAASYDAVMVFGGSQHPDQDDRFGWLGREEEFLREVLAEEVPVFGVCLGAQMLARAAGASVGPASAPEIGWLDVSLTADGPADPVLGVLPARATVFQWHHYTFTAPAERHSARRQRDLPAGVPPRRPAGLGDPVPRRGHARHGRRAGWRRIPEDLPMPADELRAESEARMAQSNVQGRALAEAFLREAAALARLRRTPRATTRATSRRSCAPGSRRPRAPPRRSASDSPRGSTRRPRCPRAGRRGHAPRPRCGTRGCARAGG